ncbi:hypothetical protein HK098_003451 [Nowakowskiella sp. JEL0407]|nr:hypothetical protein HK098_003451 [Nowakowskiella sp. JEL0407]
MTSQVIGLKVYARAFKVSPPQQTGELCLSLLKTLKLQFTTGNGIRFSEGLNWKDTKYEILLKKVYT